MGRGEKREKGIQRGILKTACLQQLGLAVAALPLFQQPPRQSLAVVDFTLALCGSAGGGRVNPTRQHRLSKFDKCESSFFFTHNIKKLTDNGTNSTLVSWPRTRISWIARVLVTK